MHSTDGIRLYSDLARWWPLFSPPEHYVEEAADLLPRILGATSSVPRTLLELGCGGGSLAYHFKAHMALTLSDISAEMLAQSRAINPECEHVLGDMRSLNLGREFDRVFVHDAITYATEPEHVRATLATARRHCSSDGAVIVISDCVRETFEPKTDSGGTDGPDGRGLRYVEWQTDPDPEDHWYESVFAFLFREPDGRVTADSDRHRHGLFPRADWLRWSSEVGLRARSSVGPWGQEVFVATVADG